MLGPYNPRSNIHPEKSLQECRKHSDGRDRLSRRDRPFDCKPGTSVPGRKAKDPPHQTSQARLTYVCTLVHTNAMVIAGVEWGDGNRDKCQKHGVSMTEIDHMLMNEPRVAPDHEHSSEAESRQIAVGRIEVGRPIFVAFTLRFRDGDWYARPISAQYMHQSEVKAYENEST